MYSVFVKSTKSKGRGVFAAKNFHRGEIIEKCPVITLTSTEYRKCRSTILDHYFYDWKSGSDAAAVLGYGMIYNHSYNPNATYHRQYSTHTLTYIAIKDIQKGEEITVNYHGHPQSTKRISWFKVVK
jgi:hypothetical protein